MNDRQTKQLPMPRVGEANVIAILARSVIQSTRELIMGGAAMVSNSTKNEMKSSCTSGFHLYKHWSRLVLEFELELEKILVIL